ncbi:MAG TPA: hypothetical protein VEK33_16815 [Terriglobales bacterium]|nr:hypothetical protein [Terriglobales bacterium]
MRRRRSEHLDQDLYNHSLASKARFREEPDEEEEDDEEKEDESDGDDREDEDDDDDAGYSE